MLRTCFFRDLRIYGRASERQLSDKYVISNMSIYEVSEDFPRLTRSRVHLAINEVRYEISIGALSAFEVSRSAREIVNDG